MNQESLNKESKAQECCGCHNFGNITYISIVVGIWHDCVSIGGVMRAFSWCTKWEEASEADLLRINKELADARKIQKARG